LKLLIWITLRLGIGSSMNKSKKLIEIFDKLESRAAKWLLAVDENIKSLKSYLERVGFRVITFESGLDDEEIHTLLQKKKVDFFITKNGKDFVDYVIHPAPPNLQYSLIWVFQDMTADLSRLAKTIEQAIIYDRNLRNRNSPGYQKITGQYVTELPRIRAEYLKSQKK